MVYTEVYGRLNLSCKRIVLRLRFVLIFSQNPCSRRRFGTRCGPEKVYRPRSSDPLSFSVSIEYNRNPPGYLSDCIPARLSILLAYAPTT